MTLIHPGHIPTFDRRLKRAALICAAAALLGLSFASCLCLPTPFLLLSPCKTGKKRFEDVLSTFRRPLPLRTEWGRADKCKVRLVLVIIEPRDTPSLRGVLNNAAGIYGGDSDTVLCVIHGRQNRSAVMEVVGSWKGVTRYELDEDNLTIPQYNQLMTDPRLYRSLKELAQYALVFQTDCLLFRRVDPCFYEYDYVGAPWLKSANNSPSHVGNGGLSLRNVAACERACSEVKYDGTCNEDVYFSRVLCSVCPWELAKSFSVEQIFHANPCGMHKAYEYLTDKQMTTLYANVPHVERPITGHNGLGSFSRRDVPFT